jgi:SAM-dependent methyltransferase
VAERKELLLGCGSNPLKKMGHPDHREWSGLVRLDFNDAHQPDVVHDLSVLPLPFADDSFDEVHAYDVMEHIGTQGDWRFFFAQWQDIWRILKHGGRFYGLSPHWSSPWAWMDPGHTRAMGPEMLVFLDQLEYAQVGKSPMTDYRFCYAGDFHTEWAQVDAAKQFSWVLRAVKPARRA